MFPYTSHNSLHFSRCSYYPFTHDCPWIVFTPEGRFVTRRPDPSGWRGNIVDPLPDFPVDTDDPHVAVAAVVGALPLTWEQVWIGDVENPPTESDHHDR
jgi:Family of unknown function (DUF6193)